MLDGNEETYTHARTRKILERPYICNAWRDDIGFDKKNVPALFMTIFLETHRTTEDRIEGSLKIKVI